MTHDEMKQSSRASGFMSFGASPNICPGRHFATGAILATAVMLMLRYDITPRNGRWIRLRVNLKVIASIVSSPIKEFPVTISARKAFQGLEWVFTVKEGKGMYPLMIG
jgi:hypothetical protein